MELKENAVQRPGFAQRIDEELLCPLVSVLAHRAVKAGEHEMQRNQVPSALTRAAHEAGDRTVAVAKPFQHLGTGKRRALKTFQRDALGCEGVCRDQKSANSNTHLRSSVERR